MQLSSSIASAIVAIGAVGCTATSPVFDPAGMSPPLYDTVRSDAAQSFRPTVAVIDTNEGDVLSARLFVDIPSMPYSFFGQEFKLTGVGGSSRRVGTPLTALNYCSAFDSTTVRVVVTDGKFSDDPGKHHLAVTGFVIEGAWRLECN